MNDKEFIGRNKEIEEFKEFLIGERPNWGCRGKGAPLLLVVGESPLVVTISHKTAYTLRSSYSYKFLISLITR